MRSAKRPERLKDFSPVLDPEYPVKPWIAGRTGKRFQTVSVRQNDGSYLALIVEAPEIRCTAKTRKLAEHGAMRLYAAERHPRFDDEGRDADQDDDRFIREADKKGKFISLEAFQRRVGRRSR